MKRPDPVPIPVPIKRCGSWSDLASPDPIGRSGSFPPPSSILRIGTPLPSTDDTDLDTLVGFVCPQGHPLIELSNMCDICKGAGRLDIHTSGKAPIYYCVLCGVIICTSCAEDMNWVCMNHHEIDTRLRLICDKCDYCSQHSYDRRRDPVDGEFRVRNKFKGGFASDELWNDAERYQPHGRDFFGCRECDYDICERCSDTLRDKLQKVSLSVNVRGTRVHILSFRPDTRRRESPLSQMLALARIAIPAVLNFLYLKRTTRRACLYLGRYDEYGRTVGMQKVGDEGGKGVPIWDCLRTELMRICTHEVWPPLRADTPGSSLRANRESLLSNMQALLWVKRVGTEAAYGKVILQNPCRLYFDNVQLGQDKYRWTNRRLYRRQLDNLESEKAVDSYEAYEQSLRVACRYAMAHYAGKQSGATSPNIITGCGSVTFCQRLHAEEDSQLDYKSYWIDPVGELLHHVPKFMCGFANAYGKGKLLVGVIEVQAHELLKHPDHLKLRMAPNSEGRIPLVLGVTLQPRAMKELTKGLTQAFKNCIPPMPMEWVTLVRHSVLPPRLWTCPFTGQHTVLYIYMRGSMVQDRVSQALRAMAHRALRSLLPYGMALVELIPGSIPNETLPTTREGIALLRFAVVHYVDPPDPDPRAVDLLLPLVFHTRYHHQRDPIEPPAWRNDMHKRLAQGANQGPVCFTISDTLRTIQLPPLEVIEIRMKRDDSYLAPVDDKSLPPPLIFTGWPVIPVWDEINDKVISIRKDLDLLERRRLKERQHNLLKDPLVLVRILEYLAPPDGPCLSPSQRKVWCVVMEVRLVCSEFKMAAHTVLNISAFEWPATDSFLRPRRMPVHYGALANLRRLHTHVHHPTPRGIELLPAAVLFYLTVGDIPMPYPYTLIPAASPRCLPTSLHLANGGTVKVTPFLNRLMPDGLSERLDVVIVHSSSLLCKVTDNGTLEAVRGVAVRPFTVNPLHHHRAYPLGGFEFVTSQRSGTAWDISAFMAWLRVLVKDSSITLCDSEGRTFAIQTTSRNYEETACDPRLCSSHSIHVGNEKDVSTEECDWHQLEEKWQRNAAKKWRL
eukprot:Sspe_Gene.18839::Locus_6811_Transcript_3_4_Confidence_0.333_Length_3635::g.18839::m.18839